jgi:tetratricopeptide (TPR) repeat protein
MSFAQGLTAGSQMAQGWIEAYENADEKKRKRLAQEEIAKLGRTDTESSTQGIQTAPQQSIMRQPQQEAPQDNLGTGTYGGEDYSGGVGVRGGLAPQAPVAPRPVAPQAQAPMQAQQAPAQAQGLSRGTPNADRLMQEAEIYAKQGLTEQATRARERAYEVGRQEKADSRVEEEYLKKKNNEKAISELGAVLAKGEDIDLPTIYKAAQAAGADPTVLTAFVGDSLGITEKMATAKVNKMARDVQAASSDPVKLNEYIRKNADPNPNDNIIPELRQVRGGWAIMYGDKLLPGTQVYPDSRDVPGFTAMAYDMVEKAKGNVLGWAIQKQSMEKNAAAIRASDAQAASASRTANKPDWMSAVDSKGQLQLVDRNKLPVKEGVAELPKGLKPVSARAEYTAADALKLSDQLIGQTNPSTNKPFTAEEAVAESKRILSGAQDPFMAKLDAVLGGTGDPFAKPSAADKGKDSSPAKTPSVEPEAEQRFVRQKTNRGAYTYTPSPRGLTKAQFAEIDRNRQ